jgi:transposase
VPLAVEISAGNERELHYLLPLIDRVCADGRQPLEVWADRGYDANALRVALEQRGIQPVISRRRRAGDPIPEGTPTREIWHGRKRYRKVADPNGRHRWPVERTNAWLHNWRRISTRWERRPELYLALLQLACSMIIQRQLEWSF